MKKIYRREIKSGWLHVWFLIISVTVAHAQTIQTPTIQWQRLLGTAYRSSDYQPQVVRASSDGFAVLNGKVIRLNDSGNTIWETTLPDLPEYPGYYTNPTHIAATPDGGFGVLVYNQFKWSLARLNSDGTVRWLKSFADNPPRNGLDRLTFTKLIYTVDGGFLAMAISSYPRMGSSTVLYKFDVNGINTLSKGIGFSDEKDPRPSSVGSDVVQIADGNYILVGKTSVSSTYPADWVVKFTNELVVVWQRAKVQTGKGLNSIIVSPYDNKAAIAVGSATGADTRSLTISTNGDIADNVTLANYTNSTSSFLAAGANPGSHTIVDIVNERQGDIRLQTVVGQTLSYLQKLGGSGAETITGGVAGADGGFLIIGATNSTDGDVQGKTNTDAEVWLVKVGPVSNSVYSVKSGNWNDPSVWSCNCAPAAWQNVTINGPHTVRLDATMPAAACLNLEIIGTFSMQGSSITINGASVMLDDANVVTN